MRPTTRKAIRMNMAEPIEAEDDSVTPSAELPARVQTYLLTVPLSWRRVATRVLSGNGTPSQERRVKCGDCCGWDRDSIRDCTVSICAHWHKRPFAK